MITATVQGKSQENNRKHISAQDGQIITGKKEEEQVTQLYRDCDSVNLESDELYCKLKNGKFFCALYHPENDDIGRRRIALIVWDKDTSDEMIQHTLEVMGLEYERFKKLEQEYKQKKALVAIGIIALVGFGIYLLAKN
ncbi:hypothetical protein [Helicobacter sp. T3_23-1056]